jgi:NDP-sugar pyrophosphorylase family protein
VNAAGAAASLPCVVLAGGLGTRMRPITETIPKALIEVAGRPFADIQMEWLARQGVRDVVYSIGHHGERLRDVVGDGSRFGLRVTYVDEGADLRGTAGALRMAMDEGHLPDTFFLLYGDSYLRVDLGDVERTWRDSGLPSLMTVMRNAGRWDRSNAILRDGRVVVYDKHHPERHGEQVQWIDYGLSVLTAGVVAEALPSGGRGDLAVVLHDLAGSGRLAGYEVAKRFYEIGSPSGLRDFEDYLLRTAGRPD